MVLSIRVVPKASRNLVKEEKGALKVYLTKPAQDGLANEQLIDLLSKHLNIKKYRIEIIKGFKSRDKLVKING
ncbi:MAG: DUF167 domain-containing protein [Candidatus Omnitrophica bacterium]|nr:DUF167 domain-containing protein [Candidatus Omnitrophota bacterium]MBU1869266.1 DUF167 domain-containing protein [Candidatus Omnitrophota bacterium]